MAQLYGGKLLATGSKSCVIHPNIHCNNNKYKKRSKKLISKIVFGDTAKEYSTREKNINDMIRRIPGYKKWALIFDELCKPPSLNDSISIDKDISKCLEEDTFELHSGIERKKQKLFDKNSIMLIGDYGGITLGDYFSKHFENLKDIKHLEKNFLDCMIKIDPIFRGLVDLQRYNIIHLDIKPNNIVMHGNSFKFIDFGLSNKVNETNHFLRRSMNEFKTARVYVWYPLEYIFFNATKQELELEKQKIDVDGIDGFRNHMSMYNYINNFFGRNTINDVNSIIKQCNKNNKDKFIKEHYSDLIKGVDTYSFGMLMPFLFFTNELLEYVEKSEILTEFFTLFRDMCQPYYENRLKIDQAYILFKILLEKYTKKKNTKKQNKKKTRKKTKTRRNKNRK